MSVESQKVIEELALMNPEAIVFDDLDEAITGIDKKGVNGSESVLVYSTSKILDCLQKQGLRSREEAIEYYDFNIDCLGAGPYTPKITDDEE